MILTNQQHSKPVTDLPLILAGPILRRTRRDQLVVWLVTSQSVRLELACYQGEQCLDSADFEPEHTGHVQLGEHAHLHLLQLAPRTPFPQDEWLEYDIGLKPLTGTGQTGAQQWLADTLPNLMFNAKKRPDFMIKSRVDHILHGSCRKPHHADTDGLLRVHDVLAEARKPDTDIAEQPALLMMTGDQIYADDVAGPMLVAIHQVTDLLGLYDEDVEGLESCQRGRELRQSEHNLYDRTHLLPDDKANATLRETFFMGARKPIFTSVNADNHLITLSEVLGMYLLVWSPLLWEYLDPEQAVTLPEGKETRYQAELGVLRRFAAGLEKVQRALAHVPVYMIFDDHDVTDDWNLTRGWEESAYNQPFSRQIIGNALIGYLLCQGWGNTPEKFPTDLMDEVRYVLRQDCNKAHDALIDRLIKFRNWHYVLDTHPRVVVLDIRTQRWRSEYGSGEPSGLMDWEALSDLQHELLHDDAVILVSPAPIFGVKIIEVVQRVFTWFGHALTVDAENWMAHRGAAYVILNIFRHPKTPQNFVILSGDVHYSFAYDVRLRGHDDAPRIWQITCSGVKSTFPKKLLRLFDSLNLWLFATYSPLNLLTRRRNMRIRPRRPGKFKSRYRHQRLLNGNGIGRVRLDKEGAPEVIEVLWSDGEDVAFTQGYETDWH